MSNKEHEKLAREAAEEIGHTTEHLLWRRTQIILAAIEKAYRWGYSDGTNQESRRDVQPQRREPQEWTSETVGIIADNCDEHQSPMRAIAAAHNADVAAIEQEAYARGLKDWTGALTAEREKVKNWEAVALGNKRIAEGLLAKMKESK